MGSKFCNQVWSIIMKFEQRYLVLRCFEGNNICCNILSRSKKRHITNREIINRKVGALILISSLMLQLLKAKIQRNASYRKKPKREKISQNSTTTKDFCVRLKVYSCSKPWCGITTEVFLKLNVYVLNYTFMSTLLKVNSTKSLESLV